MLKTHGKRLLRRCFWVFLTLSVFHLSIASGQAVDKRAKLRLPSTQLLRDYETKLYTWLMNFEYKKLKWDYDKEVRDTGPYTLKSYYGTHPAVRIYYSPGVIQWMKNNRQGTIPDGAMIIKEMYAPPAVMYQELENAPQYKNDKKAYDAMLGKLIQGWTVMVRDSAGSKDGWFWAQLSAPQENQSISDAVASQLDNYSHELYSSFGGLCLRCHASAESEFTFSALENVETFMTDKDPLRFLVDTSWRSEAHFKDYPLSQLKDDPYVKDHFMIDSLLRPWSNDQIADYQGFIDAHLRSLFPPQPTVSVEGLKAPNPEFLTTFPSIHPVQKKAVKPFPSWWADHVVASPEGERYLTSSNCLGCHGGLGGSPYGVSMFVQTGPGYGEGYNLSEFGEWRWSPMGLAGRDPIFHAQLESEMAYLERDGREHPEQLHDSVEETQIQLTNTCLSCHGAMGQRSLAHDAEKDSSLDRNFKTDYFYLVEALSSNETLPPDYKYHKYGELAREGISCAVCHHIDAPDPQAVIDWTPKEGWINESTPKELAYMLFHNTTGHYNYGSPDEFYGPFEKVADLPMKHSLGITPVYNPYTSDSQLCGTCHTINLPNVGLEEDKFPVLTAAEPNPALKKYNHSIEQATFLEWQNSAFARGKGVPGSDFASCQDCHMPNTFKTVDGNINIDPVTTQIATIQDANYPAAEHILPVAEIDVPLRSEYKRHEHVGLNAFLLEMFDQFPDVLGVSKGDPMTSAKNGVDLAIENMVRQAREDTVDLSVTIDSFTGKKLQATVNVTNKAGHRLPSGVAFRRVFLEFSVMDGTEVVWASGRTNSVGVILGADGKPLPSEFLPDSTTYQPHYQKITSEDQVQIYEELIQNSDREFTTSFIHRVHHIKDNRLLPKGWRAAETFKSQGEVMYQFMESTDPLVEDDPDYQDQGPNFPGKDSLQYVVTLPYEVDDKDLSVKVSIYSQAIPPYWLHQRFSTVPDGVATRRLYYLTSHLNLEGTPLQDWKFLLTSATATASSGE